MQKYKITFISKITELITKSKKLYKYIFSNDSKTTIDSKNTN